MNADSLTKTIDRREQFYERYRAHQAVLMNRYTRMLSAKKLSKPDEVRQRKSDALA